MAGDANMHGNITIDEVLAAVYNAANGCFWGEAATTPLRFRRWKATSFSLLVTAGPILSERHR